MSQIEAIAADLMVDVSFADVTGTAAPQPNG